LGDVLRCGVNQQAFFLRGRHGGVRLG
jgi:hypothetical protein